MYSCTVLLFARDVIFHLSVNMVECVVHAANGPGWLVVGIPGQYFDLNQLVRQSANTPTILEGVTYDSR